MHKPYDDVLDEAARECLTDYDPGYSYNEHLFEEADPDYDVPFACGRTTCMGENVREDIDLPF